MYILVNIVDNRLQHIISKELMNGFEETFHLKSKDMKDIVAQIDDFCDEIELPIDSKMQHDFAVYKIIGMYQEISDPNFKYTFDEHGEYILSQILRHQFAMFEDFISCCNNDTADNNERTKTESSIKNFWNTSLSNDDITYVKAFAEDYFEGMKQDFMNEDAGDCDECLTEYDEMKYLFIDRVTYFPLMAYEITSDVIPEFLFWDNDYLFIEEWGIKNFEEIKHLISENGMNLGFSGVDENTQIYTGSSRYELTD